MIVVFYSGRESSQQIPVDVIYGNNGSNKEILVKRISRVNGFGSILLLSRQPITDLIVGIAGSVTAGNPP